jgi:hypothetical protein
MIAKNNIECGQTEILVCVFLIATNLSFVYPAGSLPGLLKHTFWTSTFSHKHWIPMVAREMHIVHGHINLFYFFNRTFRAEVNISFCIVHATIETIVEIYRRVTSLYTWAVTFLASPIYLSWWVIQMYFQIFQFSAVQKQTWSNECCEYSVSAVCLWVRNLD